MFSYLGGVVEQGTVLSFTTLMGQFGMGFTAFVWLVKSLIAGPENVLKKSVIIIHTKINRLCTKFKNDQNKEVSLASFSERVSVDQCPSASCHITIHLQIKIIDKLFSYAIDLKLAENYGRNYSSINTFAIFITIMTFPSGSGLIL